MTGTSEGGGPWPARPRPLPDELLSSWIVRLAAAHEITPHALTALTWPGKPVWNRDIDVLPDPEILTTLAERTRLATDVIRGSCYADYDGALFVGRSTVGKSPWILPLGMYNMNRRAFGLQYCPDCLAEDAEPYFRRAWRLACITLCVRHDRVLQDRCPECAAPVVFFRSPRSRRTLDPMALCRQCRFDLRLAARETGADAVPENLPLLQRQLERTLSDRWAWIPRRGHVQGHLYFTVLRQVVRLLATGEVSGRLRAAVCERYGVAQFEVQFAKGREEVEQLGLADRCRLMALALALLSNWPDGFVEVCREARVFARTLWHDMRAVPFWYWIVVHDHLDQTKYEPTVEEIAWCIAKNEEIFGGRYVPPNRRIRYQSIWNAQGINLSPQALQARRRRQEQRAAKRVIQLS